MELQKVRHDLATEQQQQQQIYWGSRHFSGPAPRPLKSLLPYICHPSQCNSLYLSPSAALWPPHRLFQMQQRVF